MSQFIKFYFTSSTLNMFRILIHPTLGVCDFSVVSPHWLCVPISTCVGVSVWLVGVVSVWQAEVALQSSTRIPPQPATPKLQHTSKQRTHNQCGDTTEKSQAPDDGCIDIQNTLSTEEVK